MLIRTLLLALFLISSAFSACTAESALPTPDKTMTMKKSASATSDTAMTMEESLERVTISAEDWLDGDTYYIRYTFTNPTDVAIDKKVDLTTVKYERCTQNDPFEKQYQCSDSLTHLTIPPYGTYEATIALPQTSPADFNRLLESIFYFLNGSNLTYAKNLPTKKIPPCIISTFINPNNEIFLSLYNNSSLPIMQLNDISFSITNNTLQTAGFIQKTLPINPLPPHETQTIHLFTLPTDMHITLNSSDYWHLNIIAKMNIDGSAYTYQKTTLVNASIEQSDEQSKIIPACSVYHPTHHIISQPDSYYFIDSSYLYGYIKHHHPSAAPIAPTHYKILLRYFDTHHTHKAYLFTIVLPSDDSLPSDEVQYFSFNIPLPLDFDRLLPTDLHLLTARLFCDFDEIAELDLYPISQTPLPIPQDQYTPLKHIRTNQVSESLTSL